MSHPLAPLVIAALQAGAYDEIGVAVALGAAVPHFRHYEGVALHVLRELKRDRVVAFVKVKGWCLVKTDTAHRHG